MADKSTPDEKDELSTNRSPEFPSIKRRWLPHAVFKWLRHLSLMGAGLLILVKSPPALTYAGVGLIAALAVSVVVLAFRSKDPDAAFRELLRAVSRFTDFPTLPSEPDENADERSGQRRP